MNQSNTKEFNEKYRIDLYNKIRGIFDWKTKGVNTELLDIGEEGTWEDYLKICLDPPTHISSPQLLKELASKSLNLANIYSTNVSKDFEDLYQQYLFHVEKLENELADVKAELEQVSFDKQALTTDKDFIAAEMKMIEHELNAIKARKTQIQKPISQLKDQVVNRFKHEVDIFTKELDLVEKKLNTVVGDFNVQTESYLKLVLGELDDLDTDITPDEIKEIKKEAEETHKLPEPPKPPKFKQDAPKEDGEKEGEEQITADFT